MRNKWCNSNVNEQELPFNREPNKSDIMQGALLRKECSARSCVPLKLIRKLYSIRKSWPFCHYIIMEKLHHFPPHRKVFRKIRREHIYIFSFHVFPLVTSLPLSINSLNMASEQPIRIGIIGTGIFAYRHHRAYQAVGGDKFQIVACANRSKEKALAFAKEVSWKK